MVGSRKMVAGIILQLYEKVYTLYPCGANANLKVCYRFVCGGFFPRRNYAKFASSTPLKKDLTKFNFCAILIISEGADMATVGRRFPMLPRRDGLRLLFFLPRSSP
jgi:hypothetical protein